MLARIQTSLRWRFLSPSTPSVLNSDYQLLTLGSKYGRKTFAKDFLRSTTTVLLSGGVGEDISFDLEFQALTGGKIILVDPTPASIRHISGIQRRVGKRRESEYSDTSSQSPKNYSLEEVDFGKISFIPKALWSIPTKIHFFEPKDSTRDGSYSVNSIHNNYKKVTPFVEVETITISEIMTIYSLDMIDLLKLDIEGAALEVLSECFSSGIFPRQILIEIDELHFPSLKSRRRAQKIFKILKKVGYVPINRDNCDFLFLRLNPNEQ